MVAPNVKPVKARNTTKRKYIVSSLDNGFSMPAHGLRGLGRLLDICAIEGTYVKVTIVKDVKGGDTK